MPIQRQIKAVAAACIAAFGMILAAQAALAYEPGWRQVSTGLEGGTVTALALSPTYSSDGILYAVTDEGRLFRGSGGVWSAVHGEVAGKRVVDVLVSPNFAGDKEVFVVTRESGVYVFNDTQKSWRGLGLTGNTLDTVSASPQFLSDKTLYVGGHGVLYRLTSDGQNQTQLANGVLAADGALVLAFSANFASDSTIFAGTKFSGVVISTDGGGNWAVAGVDGKEISSLVLSGSTLFAASPKDGIFRSVDSGATWQPANTGLPDARVSALALSPDYANDNTVYTGLMWAGLFKSTDGGANWTEIIDPLLPKGVESIALSPAYASDNSLVVGMARDLGIILSTNGGSSWSRLNSGLSGLSIGDLVIWSNLADRTTLFARAYPLGLFKSEDLAASWASVLSTPNLVQAIGVSPNYGNDRTVYMTVQYIGVYRSQNGGADWTKINSGLTDGLQIKSVALSPAFQSDNTLFAGMTDRGVFRSTNRGDSWQRVYTDTQTAHIEDIAISPNFAADGTLFATVDNRVLRSTDRGNSWHPPQGGLPERKYSDLAVSPDFANDSTIFAAYYGKTIYRSVDGGQNWSAVSTLPGAATALVISPDFPKDGTLYAGTEEGVYVSTDRGESWAALESAAPIWSVDTLAISRGLSPKLYAGTKGSGVWQYNTDLPSPNLSCGDTITATVTLDADLSCTGRGLVISGASNITVDCNHHVINRIEDPQQPFPNGIEIINSTGVTVRDCKINGFHYGVAIFDSTNSTVAYNELADNYTGIQVQSLGRAGATGNSISNNSILSSSFGIVLGSSATGSKVNANTIMAGQEVDVKVEAPHIAVSDNTLIGSGLVGIRVAASPPVTVTANAVSGRDVALQINGNSGLFSGNVWWDNNTGAEVQGSSTDNLLYNNVFSNTTNLFLAPTVGVNRWHVDRTEGSNSIGGSFLGGNFWGSPGGNGFSQTCPDSEPDGICDGALDLGSGNVDQHPLAAASAALACAAGPHWSILVYLNGDNDLDFWTVQLFNRLEQVMASGNPCVRIVALWDRRGDENSNIYLVQPDSNPFGLAAYTPDVTIWPQGELDMGNPQTLINFINWAKARFPAQHTMLSIVGHGNGWSPSAQSTPLRFFSTGVSFDDSGGGSYLSTENLGEVFGRVFQNGSDPIDLVYFDACLMAMTENLHPLQGFVDFVVASENQSYTSYPYDRFLAGIDAATTPQSLAVRIVDEHHQSLPGYPRTLAAFDLSRMASVSSAVDGLARALLDGDNRIPPAYVAPLQTAFAQTQRFDSNVDLTLDASDGYVDLHHFASQVQAQIADQSVQAAAAAVNNALRDGSSPLVIHNRATTGRFNSQEWDLTNAQGLSIYLPMVEPPDWRQDFYNGQELSFANETAWDEFVHALLDAAEIGDGARPDAVDQTDRPGGPLEVSISTIYLPALTKQ